MDEQVMKEEDRVLHRLPIHNTSKSVSLPEKAL